MKKITFDDLHKMTKDSVALLRRKNFDFEFDREDVKKLIEFYSKDIFYGGDKLYTLGRFIGYCCNHKGEILDIPEIFSNNRVCSAFSFTVFDSLLDNPFPDQISAMALRSFASNTPLNGINDFSSKYFILINASTINSSDNGSCISEYFYRLAKSFSRPASYGKYYQKIFDYYAENLNKTTFRMFINSLIPKIPNFYDKCSLLITEKIIDRLEKENLLEGNIINIIQNFSVNNENRHVNRSLYLHNGANLKRLYTVKPFKIHGSQTRLLRSLLDNNELTCEDAVNMFSFSDNISLFAKLTTLDDDTFIKLSESEECVSSKVLREILKVRPDIYFSIMKKTLENRVRSRLNASIDNDIKELIDNGMLKINISVETDDEDALMLYLNLKDK